MSWNVEFLYKKFMLNTFENYLIKIDNIQYNSSNYNF